jgi:FkbM family methyltransferase
LAKRGDLIALNTCRYDYSKRFFDNLCRENGIPYLNYEQAVRAFGLQGKLDHRVDDWGKTIVENAGRYLALARRLDDPFSVETLFGVLNFHLTCDPEHSHQIERPYSTLYFRSGLLEFTEAERMVDCGASIGESLAGLIGTTKGVFEHSWMIEPDRLNIEKLKDILRRLEGTNLESKVSLHGVALGAKEDRVLFNHVGGHGGTILPPNGNQATSDLVDVRAVDDIIDTAPTFIKMDIEGAELGALKGCRTSIETAKPKLAISAYHRARDLFELTDYVLSLNPSYKVGLRHHTEERWDTCLYFY